MNGTCVGKHFNGNTVNFGNSVFDGTGTQITGSEGHLWPPREGEGLQDRGGNFRTTRSYVDSNVLTVSLTDSDGFWTYNYNGPITPIAPPQSYWPPSGESSNSRLTQLGATAVSRCAPGDPPGDLSTFLGELFKEGLPSLVGSQSWQAGTSLARQRKAAGSEYLNVQFGYMPIAREISKFADILTRADQILDQYERDAGRLVRRRYNFPIERSTEEVVAGTNRRASGPPLTNFFTGGVTLIRHRETTRRQWFSGAFTYYIPSDYFSRNELRRLAAQADALFGLDFDLETAWNLTPWSWVADWFSNAGDVIHNIQRFGSGNLVMPYGYIMEHSIVRDTYTLSPSTLKSGDVPAPLTLVTETKKRLRANPFGFGVSFGALSAFQTSILIALGLSRS